MARAHLPAHLFRGQRLQEAKKLRPCKSPCFKSTVYVVSPATNAPFVLGRLNLDRINQKVSLVQT
jgi:hypothetical protein